MRIVETSNPGSNGVQMGHKAVNGAIPAALFPYPFGRPQGTTQRSGCWNLGESDGVHRTLGVIDGLSQQHEPVLQCLLATGR